MRFTERPLTFEQEYPKYSFAPLVELAVAVVAWAVRRRAAGRAEHAGAPVRPAAGEMSLAKHLVIAVTVSLAMAATSSHVRADASLRAKPDSGLASVTDRAPSAAVTRTSEVLASVVAHYESDGLDTYAQDMRAFGRSAFAPTMVSDACARSRAGESLQESRRGTAVSATRAQGPAVGRSIDPPAARKLFQGAEFNIKDGLDVYDRDFRPKTGSLLAVSKR